MFGYIKPSVPELKVKEHEVYKAVYCGLCKSMGKSTCHSARAALSYDFVYLALLRAALCGEKITIVKQRCPLHPMKKRQVALAPGCLDYTAKASAILTYYKIDDDIRDSDGIHSLKYRLILPSALKAKRKTAELSSLDSLCRDKLLALSKLETSGSGDPDECAELFGDVLSAFSSYGIEGDAGRIAAEIGRRTGRWIYLADAADDFEDDRKSGSFNPFHSEEKLPPERISVALKLQQSAINSALELLDCENRIVADILFNIVRIGMSEVADGILFKKDVNYK